MVSYHALYELQIPQNIFYLHQSLSRAKIWCRSVFLHFLFCFEKGISLCQWYTPASRAWASGCTQWYCKVKASIYGIIMRLRLIALSPVYFEPCINRYPERKVWCRSVFLISYFVLRKASFYVSGTHRLAGPGLVVADSGTAKSRLQFMA